MRSDVNRLGGILLGFTFLLLCWSVVPAASFEAQELSKPVPVPEHGVGSLSKLDASSEKPIKLDAKARLDLSLSFSEDFRLLQADEPISGPILAYEGKSPQRIVMSSRSKTGRFAVLFVCDEEDCQDYRLLDLKEKAIYRLNLGKYIRMDWVSWSPSEEFVLVSVEHALAVNTVAVDLRTRESFSPNFFDMFESVGDYQASLYSVEWRSDGRTFSFQLPVIPFRGSAVPVYDVTVDLSRLQYQYRKIA